MCFLLLVKEVPQPFWVDWTSWDAIAAMGQVAGAIGTFIAVWVSVRTAIKAQTQLEELSKPKINIFVKSHVRKYATDPIEVVITNVRSIPIVLMEGNIVISFTEEIGTPLSSPISSLDLDENNCSERMPLIIQPGEAKTLFILVLQLYLM